MTYTAPIIKDRVAVGDDLYIMTEVDGKVRLTPSPTNVAEPGTPINKELLQPLCEAVENAESKHATVAATISATGWGTNNTQEITVVGVKTNSTVIISPDPTSQEVWGKAQIICTAQAEGRLTFECKKTPSAAVTANIVILGG